MVSDAIGQALICICSREDEAMAPSLMRGLSAFHRPVRFPERAFAPVHQSGENVVGDLAKLKLRPDDVDVVINSHLHMDHCGCNEFFKKATFFVHEGVEVSIG